MTEYLLIVERNRRQLFETLTDQFSDGGKVQVLLDRRSGERRQSLVASEAERRRAERRGVHKRSDWFVMVRKQTP